MQFFGCHLQGTTSLLTTSAPVWILGVQYHDTSSADADQEGAGLKQEVISSLSSANFDYLLLL
jgi:hypothetical protein